MTQKATDLYGERLFDEYEKRFLKRDAAAAVVARVS
jgi:hypothetical protein